MLTEKIGVLEKLGLRDSISTTLEQAKKVEKYSINDRDEIMKYYLVKLKYSQGKEKIQYLEKYNKLLQEIIQDNKGIQTAKINFEIDKKSLEDHLQKEKQLKRKNNFIYLLVIILVTLFSIIILFLNTKRNKLTLKNKKLELDILQTAYRSAQIERNRISRELHDDLGATFTSINMATNILKEQQLENTKYLDIIHNNSARMNQKINEIIWSLNTKNDTLESLVAYITKFSKKFLENTPIQLLISKHEEIAINIEKFIPSERRRIIYLACKEIINNTVKHAEASEIKLNFSLLDNEFSIIISDNGKGFEPLTANNGNGLKNIKDNMEYISANYHLETSEKGTIHKIIIKI